MKRYFGMFRGNGVALGAKEPRIRAYWAMLTLLGLSLFVAACATIQVLPNMSSHDRGVKIPHEIHTDMACADCHQPGEKTMGYPNHGICENCHEIDVDNPDEQKCGLCHTNTDYEIKPRTTRPFSDEIRFDHAPHAAKEVACNACHLDPEKQLLPDGKLMPFCMDCHAKQDAKFSECQACHTRVSKETRPETRNGVRIAHDSPAIWEQVHGGEWRKDEAYCAMCHKDQEFCSECHRKTEPKNHTAAWRSKTHGMRAEWDRRTCAVCHEEDMCMQCHEHTQPSNHRGSWGGPRSRHCQTCHFPPERTDNCTTCHERIEHEMAPVSPHKIGNYPVPCGQCHPGVPGRAPHMTNSTVRCQFCH